MSTNRDANEVKSNLKALLLNMLDSVWKEERITTTEHDAAVKSFSTQFDRIDDTRDQIRLVARWSNTLSDLIDLGRR